MLAPLSWLKEYVDIKLSPKELSEKLTEVGLSTEKIIRQGDDVIFDFEVTPNRPDLLSILGIAREIAAIESKNIKFPFPGALLTHPKGVIEGLKPKKNLPIKIQTDSKINPRFTGIIIDGIKGGLNTGTYDKTKTIFLRVPVEVPVLIRRTSMSLGLRSEASSIFERGVNAGGTVDALKRCVELILDTAGGEIASGLFDIKREDFKPWNVDINLERLNKILGIEIPKTKVVDILERLNLEVEKINNTKLEITVPTYRNDLKIEEDIIEEVARLYGYNNFSKTLPIGEIPTQKVPYFKDYLIDEKVKNLLKASGFSEIYSYSLISENDLSSFDINSDKVLRVDNPVSREFEYLRPTLKINLLKALLQNKPNFEKINLFELGKVYLGRTLDEAKEEYRLCGISNNKSFYEIKGILERLLEELSIDEDPSKFIEIINEGVIFEISYSDLLNKMKPGKIFKPIPKYPPVIEDLTISINEKIPTKEIAEEIIKQNPLIESVSFKSMYKDNRTFHIVYQNSEGNLATKEVAKIRGKIIEALKQKFKAKVT